MTPYVFSANESLYDNLTKFLGYRVLAGLTQKEKMSGNALLSGNVWNFPLIVLSKIYNSM